MDTLFQTLHTLVPAAWTVATAAYLHVFLKDESRAARIARWLVVVAAALGIAELAVAGSLGRTHLASGAPVASGMAVAAAMVYLFLERLIGRGSVGVFAIGACTFMTILGGATAGEVAAVAAPLPPLPSAWTSTSAPSALMVGHIATAVMGYAGLLLAGLFGTLHVLQFRALRARRFGLFWERLPSLELLDEFTSASVGVATLFLTGTIGLGHAVKAIADAGGPYWDAKVLATNLLWLFALTVTVGRRTKRLRAQPAAVLAIALFLFALGNLLVVNSFSGIHRNV